MNKKYLYHLEGLDCANCARKIETELSKKEGYVNVNVNFSTSKLTFETDKESPKKEIVELVKRIEPDAIVIDKNKLKTEFKISSFTLIRIMMGIVLGFSTLFLNLNNKVELIILIIATLLLLPRTAFKAVKILIRSKSLDENILLTISVIGAFLINEPFEGFMVIALYEIGKSLEEMAINKSRKSIQTLMDIKPSYAALITEKEIVIKDPSEIKIDDIILVKVGERIPLDGIVTKGTTTIDTSALTGESLPRKAGINDTVLSGSINLSDVILVKVSSLYEDSTVSKILDLVENATNRKAKTENFVSKAAKIYTPIIIILALLTGILFPWLTNVTVEESIYRALSFLVISCPCAIAISVPLSYFSGIGLASKRGILIKGSDYLDLLRNIKTIVFDKTGTLTTGSFHVASVESYSSDYSKDDLIRVCAYGESLSNHPIARSIVSFYGKEIKDVQVLDYKEIPGVGISYIFENKKVEIDNQEKKKEENGTAFYVKIDGVSVGKIIIKDKMKEGSKETIVNLKKMGIHPVIFTGDNKQVAKEIAEQLSIEDVHYELLPNEKYEELEKLIKQKKNENEKIAFVGDGINDAPVLAFADIGISMGDLGQASAIEASDVVLMTDELNKITEAISISKHTTNIIKQNLIFAIGIKLLFIILNLFGKTTMALAVFADVGVTVLTILNSIRILKKK